MASHSSFLFLSAQNLVSSHVIPVSYTELVTSFIFFNLYIYPISYLYVPVSSLMHTMFLLNVCCYLLDHFIMHRIKLKFLSVTYNVLCDLTETGVQSPISFDSLSYPKCQLKLLCYSSLHTSSLVQNVHMLPFHSSRCNLQSCLVYMSLSCESSHNFSSI